MSGHTPGPWAMNPVLARVDAMPSLLPVCQLLWPTDERPEAETEANARLIAAAPELLEALKECADRLEIHIKHSEDLVAHMRAVAVIRKATGAAE